MNFNSFTFLLLFLPVALSGFYLLRQMERLRWSVFWLIGVSKIRKLNFIFHDIDWNADNTLSQVISQIPPNISVGFANTLKDIY